MDMMWGSSTNSRVRADKDSVELFLDTNETPVYVRYPPHYHGVRMTREKARRMGAALIRVANSD